MTLEHNKAPEYHKALRSPEIISTICDCSSLSDGARLSRTCKRLFGITAPLVWKNVGGAQNLLYLLGATRVVYKDQYGKDSVVFSLPSTPIDSSRFDFYAPFVQTLDIYGNPTGSRKKQYGIEGWGYLVSRARHAPILPNLSSLCVHFGGDYALWIRTLAHPTLTRIWGGVDEYYQPMIALPVTDIVLDILVKDCSDLVQLSIFPSQEMFYQDARNDELVGLSTNYAPYQHSLSKLTQLVELTCSVGMLQDDVLLVVGTLPRLERLSVHGVGGDAELYPDEIPAGSFPALRDLGLISLSFDDATSLLSVLPLMENLTRFRIKHRIDNEPSEFDDDNNLVGPIKDESDYFVSELLAFLKNSPKLLHLEIDVFFTSEDETQTDIGRRKLQDILSSLRLETFTLMGGHIWNWTRRTDILPAIWSNITVVKIWEQVTYLKDLACFARLPKLQTLLLSIAFEKVDDGPGYTSLCPLHTLTSSNYSIDEKELSYLPHSDRFLLGLFPELRKVEWMGRRPEVANSFRALSQQIRIQLSLSKSAKLLNTSHRPTNHLANEDRIQNM